MKNIAILGMGEVGKSLYLVYKESKKFNVLTKDKSENTEFNNIFVLNICIPYSNDFCDIVKTEIKNCNPKYTVIHSTIPVGTTNKIKCDLKYKNICHSPIRGNHPDLSESIKTFTKYIGCEDKKTSNKIKKHFKEIKIKSKSFKSSDNTELIKLLCTSYYGLCISWYNEIKKICDFFKVDYFDFLEWNITYNQGYKKMKNKNVIRPTLYPPNNKIGGHCIVPNAKLLNKQFNSKFLKHIIDLQ